MRARYRYTPTLLRHQQDPARVAAAREELTKPGTALSNSLAWTKPASPSPAPGVTPASATTHIPYENPQGPRVNVMAILEAPSTAPEKPLTWMATDRTWTSADLKSFLRHLWFRGGSPVPDGGGTG